MAEKLTPQQEQAVKNRGGRLLVSAAAGSGKTKVLVDRILSYLKDPIDPANLDEFLIITYTKAAAAELRGKIAAKLSEEIAQNPNNHHLRKQVQRLYLAKISTVHSFCGDILREYAYKLDVSADFRVAEESECVELQSAAIEKVLSNAYQSVDMDDDFRAFVDSQGFGRNDRQLPEIILKTYNSARCHMDPEEWLDWCLKLCDVSDTDDISQTVWAQYLIKDLQYYLDLHISALEKCTKAAAEAEGMGKPVQLLYETMDQLRALRVCNQWDDIISHASIDYGKLNFPRKDYDADMAAKIKAVREACKKGVQKKLKRFAGSSEQMIADIQSVSAAARGLIKLTRQFTTEYEKLKRRKKVLDFSDLEHKTLDLLLGKNRYGITSAAKEISRRFREVMVDEYQDSNKVQDAIFTAITGERNNCFMVGDVKQSIYQFRLADPEIFLEKYNRFTTAEKALPGEGRKVLLSSNFRSAKSVIDAVNDVFSLCMSESVGGLFYGEDERLNEGIPHASVEEPEVELYGICVNESAYTEEPAFVAKRIAELLDGTHMVREKDCLRPIRPEDIAILLRSPGSVGGYYVEALKDLGIRCCTGAAGNLLETEEVETLRSILQVVDNPQQDIPLLAVLTSKAFGFTANDLAAFRAEMRHGSIYDALRSSQSEKAKSFVNILEALRNKARTGTLTQLLKEIFARTRLDSVFASMKDGETRVDNLFGFYKLATDYDSGGVKSLALFLKYLDSLDERGLATSGEQSNSGAVTVMSIHKSKGLEFPVVILPALSRGFNNESVYAQMLCDKDLGLGLSCVDRTRRVRYPSVGKRALGAKILSESLSEELRVLYVAMTRAKDRLIMTYSAPKLEKDLSEIALRAEFTDPILMAGEADCPGDWILLCAMQRQEAGAFFDLSVRPEKTYHSETTWHIAVVRDAQPAEIQAMEVTVPTETVTDDVLARMQKGLSYEYPFVSATRTPSKQTATQLKGREKDVEAAEHTDKKTSFQKFRKPRFVTKEISGTTRGNAMHTVMQYLRYDTCDDECGVVEEIQRLVRDGYITSDDAALVDTSQITAFFATDIGKKLRSAPNVLREFKFSILEDAKEFDPSMIDEEILMQGVVDCAILEQDGITVIDFKTDRISEEDLPQTENRYHPQVTAYAKALSRIYQKPIKAKMLYFFCLDHLSIL